jgi:single-stranded DNA-binding protein
VIVDAELDWREWTDQHGHRRGAVTFKARRIVFEGRRGSNRGAGEGLTRKVSPSLRARPTGACSGGEVPL